MVKSYKNFNREIPFLRLIDENFSFSFSHLALSSLLIIEILCFFHDIYQDADFGCQKLGLTHHLSLPSSSTKMAGMEKLYQIQGSVPCKVRAKRGFATHPRSIAERVKVSFVFYRYHRLQII